MVTQTLQSLTPALSHRVKDLKYLQKIAVQLKDVLDQAPQDALNFGICHGDLHTHNVMLNDAQQLALFDFDWLGYSWRAYDLATVWWSLPRNDNSSAMMRSFLKGYGQLRSLSRYEKQALPWFVVMREFELLGFHLNMRQHAGDACINDNYFDFHIGFFKSWIKNNI